MKDRIIVFYDGKCGLCRREIEHYKRIAPNNVFVWQDITLDASYIESLGINYANGLKLLHAQDEQGKMYVGVDAFLLIWQQIPSWRILAAILDLPVIRPFANVVYRVFAAWRFNRLSHCKLSLAKNRRENMAKKLDYIHHVALQVNDLDQSVAWYISKFSCEVTYHDDSWALLKFENMSVALVLPHQHPPHFSITKEDVTSYGIPVPHRDGTSSVYIQDPSGNNIEMLKLAD